MLDAHPDLAIPPETGFVPCCASLSGTGEELRERFHNFVVRFPADAPAWRDHQISQEDFRLALEHVEPFTISDGVRCFYRLYARRQGKTRFGDKTPLYGHQLTTIEQLLPEARFVHIIRDGRDAALSLKDLPFSPGQELSTQAEFWRNNVETTRRLGAQCRHYLEVQYENLLHETESELRRICGFLELAFDPCMLRYHERTPARLSEHEDRVHINGQTLVSHEQRLQFQALVTQPPRTSRIAKWKHSMSRDQIEQFDRIAGKLLTELGYERGPSRGISAEHAAWAYVSLPAQRPLQFRCCFGQGTTPTDLEGLQVHVNHVHIDWTLGSSREGLWLSGHVPDVALPKSDTPARIDFTLPRYGLPDDVRSGSGTRGRVGLTVISFWLEKRPPPPGLLKRAWRRLRASRLGGPLTRIPDRVYGAVLHRLGARRSLLSWLSRSQSSGT